MTDNPFATLQKRDMLCYNVCVIYVELQRKGCVEQIEEV